MGFRGKIFREKARQKKRKNNKFTGSSPITGDEEQTETKQKFNAKPLACSYLYYIRCHGRMVSTTRATKVFVCAVVCDLFFCFYAYPCVSNAVLFYQQYHL